jgi:hypothetical protein
MGAVSRGALRRYGEQGPRLHDRAPGADQSPPWRPFARAQHGTAAAALLGRSNRGPRADAAVLAAPDSPPRRRPMQPLTMWSSCRCPQLVDEPQSHAGPDLADQDVVARALAGQRAAGELRQSGGTDAPVKVWVNR